LCPRRWCRTSIDGGRSGRCVSGWTRTLWRRGPARSVRQWARLPAETRAAGTPTPREPAEARLEIKLAVRATASRLRTFAHHTVPRWHATAARRARSHRTVARAAPPRLALALPPRVGVASISTAVMAFVTSPSLFVRGTMCGLAENKLPSRDRPRTAAAARVSRSTRAVRMTGAGDETPTFKIANQARFVLRGALRVSTRTGLVC
jgi:hypothetical protein